MAYVSRQNFVIRHGLMSLFYFVPFSALWLSSGLLRRIVWQKFTDVSEMLGKPPTDHRA
jgi:hypothetical protein